MLRACFVFFHYLFFVRTKISISRRKMKICDFWNSFFSVRRDFVFIMKNVTNCILLFETHLVSKM